MKKTKTCWLWIGSIQKNGYGTIGIKNHRVYAHRLSWILHNGKIPKGSGYHGTCVLHKCDVRNCVNPRHLFLGTNVDNINDKVKKNRHAKGQKIGQNKLNIAQIQKIKYYISLGMHYQTDLAKKFNVHQSMICRIASGKYWKHIN